MNISYETIRAWHEAGETAEQIQARLVSDPRHKKDIKATGGDAAKNDADLLHVLSAKMGLFFIDESAGWAGPLVDYMKGLQETDQLRVGFRKLLSVLQLTGRMVYCRSDPPTGFLTTAITQVCQNLADADPNNPYDSAAVKSEMDSLTGGRIYETATVAEVQALIDSEAAAVRRGVFDSFKTEMENTFHNPAASGTLTDGQGNKIETVEQLKAFIKSEL